MNDNVQCHTPSRRVLVITQAFPPDTETAAQRPLQFVQHLRDCGWEPVILTGTRADDKSLKSTFVDRVPEWVEVIQVSNLLERWQLIHQNKLFWEILAARVGRKITRQQNIDCIYTISSPYSTHLAGYLIARRTKKSWVVDFREPLVNHTEGTSRRPTLERFIKGITFRHADHIVTATAGFRSSLQQRYPSCAHKISVIRSGGNSDLFFPPSSPPVKQSRNRVFRFFCANYGHSLQRFLQAISLLFRRQVLKPSQVLVEVAGSVKRSEDIELIRILGLNRTVTYLGDLSRSEFIGKMQTADVLLLIEGSGRNGDLSVFETLYEYMFAKRPILALMQEGETAQILRETGTGIVVLPQDISAVALAVQDLVQKQGAVASFTPRPNLISQYSAISQTRQLAELFSRVVSGKEAESYNPGDTSYPPHMPS